MNYLWGKYLCPLNINLIFLKKFLWFWLVFVEISHDFVWFFCYPNPFPDPADQNEPTRIRNTGKLFFIRFIFCIG